MKAGPTVVRPSLRVIPKGELVLECRESPCLAGLDPEIVHLLDRVSRTLLAEVDVDNGSGELFPGSMAQVHFKTPAMTQSYIVPVSAVIFRSEGLRLGTVSKDSKGNAVAHLIPIVMGEDDGATVQIVSGLNANDQIIQDPPDSLVDGQRVTVVHPASPAGGSGAPSSSKSASESEGGN